jgi:hypothetical protein
MLLQFRFCVVGDAGNTGLVFSRPPHAAPRARGELDSERESDLVTSRSGSDRCENVLTSFILLSFDPEARLLPTAEAGGIRRDD